MERTMMKLLHVDSSPLNGNSVSRKLTASLVEAWRLADPTIEVVRRDLAAAPPDHLTGQLMEVVRFGKLEGLTARQQEELELTNALVDEFLAVGAVVIGAPMYNFSIPTQLKAWVDRIVQAGRTFRYTEQGPIGLARNKKVVIASSRGGLYAGTSVEMALDHQEAYLRAILGFMGVTDVTIVRAEGVAMGPEAQATALEVAKKRIEGLFLVAA
jgi:FMN-dependent NADH-azoreductase